MKKPLDNPYILIAIILICLTLDIISGIQIWQTVSIPCIEVPYSEHQPAIKMCLQEPRPAPYSDLFITY